MRINAGIDDRGVKAALRDFSRYSRKEPKALLEQQMSLVVRDVVRITPPNSDSQPNNRQGGEAAVRADIARAVTSTTRSSAPDASEVHKRLRSRNGRVPRGTRPTPARNVAAERRRTLAEVGWLAAGWNAAAEKLGRKLPAWISRHGNSAGTIQLRMGWPFLRITIINRVGYVGNVKNLTRRLNSALTNRAIQLEKQTTHFLERAKRRAGFR